MSDTHLPESGIASASDSWHARDFYLLGLLVLCTFALYIQSHQFQFIGYDDHLYVYENQHVLSGVTVESLRWACTAVVVNNWHPVTMITEQVLVSLFGPSAATFHTANAVLHTLNAALLFVFLRSSTSRSFRAFFVAVLWSLHPLRVESVAWVSELKDVLCGAFWLGCMIAYLSYSRRRTAQGFFLVLLLQALALLSKPMAATLPAVLLLMDYWPIRAESDPVKTPQWWARRCLEKLPLVALSVADLLYAVHTQKAYLGRDSIRFSPLLRCENAIISCASYLRDVLFPYHLLPFYLHPGMINATIPLAALVVSAVVLLGITFLVLTQLRARPYLAVGWFWFLICLIPVLGFVRLGQAARADRYTYLPSIGLTFAIVWLIADWDPAAGIARYRGAAAGALAAIVLSACTVITLGHWHDTVTLFEYCRQIQPNNYFAITYHANELCTEQSGDAALVFAKQSEAIAPRSAETHIACALAYQQKKQYSQAVDEFALALRLTPAAADLWDGLGSVRALQASEFADRQDPQEKAYRQKAIVDFRTALKCDPEYIRSMEHLAVELAALNQMDEAVTVWKNLLTLMPTNAQAQGDLADALRLNHDLGGAVQHYMAAMAAGSKNPQWETTLAFLVGTSPVASPTDVQPMIPIAKDACDQSQNRSAAALDAYAACLARVGRFDDAVAAAEQGLAQANAAHQPAIAKQIQSRLTLYQQGLPCILSSATTEPSSTQPAGAVAAPTPQLPN
jgi:tetratricopeptide (TPR) repeat protein